MFNKKFIIIISIIVLAAAGFLSYKYLGKKPESPEQFLERQLVFNIKRQDLPSQAAELYKKEFDETAGNLRKNPDSLNDWVDLGVIKKIIGDLEGAEIAWLKASEVNPQNSLSFANLGDLYGFYLNQPQKAEEMMQKAIANDPKEPEWYLRLSEIYHYSYPEKKDLTDDILLQGLSQIPDDVNLTSNLAAYYREIKDVSRAIEWYEKLLKIWPDNETAKQDLEELKKQQ